MELPDRRLAMLSHGVAAVVSERVRSPAGALVAADPASLLVAPEEVADPVLRIVLDRARSGSTPHDRSDPHQVCLAIEGGGMRGAVSAGMCVVLEAAGLVPAIDRIYGVSAGALNGWGTAAGQAALGVTHYHDAVSYGVINRMRPLVGRPVIDFELLFEELIASRKPLSFDLRGGPEFRALATSLDSYSLRVLADFSDLDELRQAVRASAALPRLGGEPPIFRGEHMADGGLIEPIPFQTAIEEGATHVLVLRSRPAGYRTPALSELGQLLALRHDPCLAELLKARAGAYNRQAGELEQGRAGRENGAHVLQIAVPDHVRVIGRLESNGERVTQAVRSGANAMASAILRDEIDLCWQPVIYRARARPASAPSVHRDAQPVPISPSRGDIGTTDLSAGSNAARRDLGAPHPPRALENLEHEAVRAVQRCGKSVGAARYFAIDGTHLAATGRRAVLTTLKPTRPRPSTR